MKHQWIVRLSIYMSALGLYLAVVGAIFYGASFPLLKIMQLPSIVVQAIAVGEVVVFSVIGTIGFIRLRRLIQWLLGAGDRSIGILVALCPLHYTRNAESSGIQPCSRRYRSIESRKRDAVEHLEKKRE